MSDLEHDAEEIFKAFEWQWLAFARNCAHIAAIADAEPTD
jgi:hypothetical protein